MDSKKQYTFPIMTIAGLNSLLKSVEDKSTPSIQEIMPRVVSVENYHHDKNIRQWLIIMEPESDDENEKGSAFLETVNDGNPNGLICRKIFNEEQLKMLSSKWVRSLINRVAKDVPRAEISIPFYIPEKQFPITWIITDEYVWKFLLEKNIINASNYNEIRIVVMKKKLIRNVPKQDVVQNQTPLKSHSEREPRQITNTKIISSAEKSDSGDEDITVIYESIHKIQTVSHFTNYNFVGDGGNAVGNNLLEDTNNQEKKTPG